ncbi:MAG: tRNA pseudouridine(38-40) synthase TruA [Bdellovibrionaceae bacterium]|nr:tRNA pseudouridine(38-40) synthase TruA [Pseudobdellovibrionaceae bacterium]
MDTKYRVLINLAYEGSEYYGWQVQPHCEPTVQGVLETRLSQIFGEPVRVVASGRTDRGAHALSQWAHFNVSKNPEGMNLLHRLNHITPDSILVKKVFLAPKEFHAQHSVVRKKYIYRVHSGTYIHPLKMRYSHFAKGPLDIEILEKLATYTQGTHDFMSFQSTGTDVENTVRTIYKCTWQQDSKNDFSFHIIGNGFLKQMVRNIVGSQLWAATQEDPVETFQHIFEAKDRRVAREPAPAHALFLKWVKYPSELDIKCRKL